MKLKKIITSFILIMFFCAGFGQTNQITKLNKSDLIGIWHWKSGFEKNNLIFYKELNKKSEFIYGSKIEILENGEFVEAYSAPCGNDKKMHNSKGKWKLDSENFILETIITNNNLEKKYKIIELKEDKLILLEIKVE